jgi:predicted tellurium resistance membrane protein TerC
MRILKVTVAFIVFRASCGALLLLMQRSSPESSMLVMLDAPTLFAYWLLGFVGIHMNIVDAADVRFFFIGVLTWASLGLGIGAIAAAVTSRHARRSIE